MTRKKNNDDAAPAPDPESEAQWREMLQAYGLSAREQLLATMPKLAVEAMTYAEFRERYNMPRSRFFRMMKAGKLPPITMVGGTKPMFKRSDAEAWWTSQPTVQPDEQKDLPDTDTDDEDEPRPARRLRVVQPRKAESVPRLFAATATTPTTGKKRGRPPREQRAPPSDGEADPESHEGRSRFTYGHDLLHSLIEDAPA